MKDIFSKSWIIENSINVCSQYEKGILTLRALHYQLVGLGMTNDTQHYKRVVIAMIDARWNELIDFDQFSDLDRTMVGYTDYRKTFVANEIDYAKEQVNAWMTNYHKNRWENQNYYPEIFIEKKALQGVFANICKQWNISLGACKGYPSLTFLHEASLRFKSAEYNNKQPIIIYFGDYDPSGEDIPRSVQDNLKRFGVEVEVRRIALMQHQVEKWDLPPAPAKDTDTRTAKWNGLGQVELDAVKPEKLISLCENAILDIFDTDLYNQLIQIEESERIEYQKELKLFVNNIEK
jgi:hypothetical protein